MDYTHYKLLEFRRRFWVFIGAKINIVAPEDGTNPEQNVGFINMQGWKLREDIRIYRDESMQQEILRIHARNIVDFAATYDIFEGDNDKPAYSLRRKGLKSTFVRDHWDVLDADGNQIGDVQETSGGLAIVRRYISIIPFVGPVADLALAFAPQTYRITMGGKLIAKLTHHKNPVIIKLTLDTTDAEAPVDARLTVATTALLSIIDANKG